MVERRFEANRKHKAGFHLKVTQEHGTQYGTSGWHCCMGQGMHPGLALPPARLAANPTNKTDVTSMMGPFKPFLGIGSGGGNFPKWRRWRGCLRGRVKLEGALSEPEGWGH